MDAVCSMAQARLPVCHVCPEVVNILDVSSPLGAVLLVTPFSSTEVVEVFTDAMPFFPYTI
jgi:hypothetical protein